MKFCKSNIFISFRICDKEKNGSNKTQWRWNQTESNVLKIWRKHDDEDFKENT